jgi:hypothetical protein
MKLLTAVALLLSLAAPSSADTVSDQLECSQFFDTVTLANLAGAPVDVTLSGGLYGGCVATPEGSMDGNAWVSVPIRKVVNGMVKKPDTYSLTSSNTATQLDWRFRNVGGTYSYFRLRVSSFGGPGARLVTLTSLP